MTALRSPVPPVKGGDAWTWQSLSPDTAGAATAQPWVRVFHLGTQCPSPGFRRRFGPLHRFDHHTKVPPGPQSCPQGRSIIYLAQTLGTALAEVFGDEPTATICPNYRVALLQVGADCRVQDLTGHGAMAIGALPSLCTGPVDRSLTQEWARAIYWDQPAGTPIDGVHYRSAHDEGPCLALFERSPGLLEITSPTCPPGGQPLLALADRVSVLLAERGVRFRPIDADDCERCRQGL